MLVYSQRGQIVVEYVLLLLIGIMIAGLLVSRMVKRDEDNPGFLIKRWGSIRCEIAHDDPGSPNSKAPTTCQW